MRSYWKHFTVSTIFAVLALATAFLLGFVQHGWSGGLSFLFTAAMLGVLETSLSFDNAVVNARILNTMSPFWRKMYLYVGMIVSVFGMRILFPLVIVWAVSSLPFGEVIAMTWQNPDKFQEILTHQHESSTLTVASGNTHFAKMAAQMISQRAGLDVPPPPASTPVVPQLTPMTL